MSVIGIASYSPLPGRLPEAVALVMTVVRSTRRFEPRATMWVTTHGGANTSDLHIVVVNDSWTALTDSYTKAMSDPATAALFAEEKANPTLAGRLRMSIANGLPGFDNPIVPAAGGPRAASIYNLKITPDMMDVQARVSALDARIGFQHSAAVLAVGGPVPATLYVVNLAPSMSALGTSVDNALADPEYHAIVAENGDAILGTSIWQEILVG